MVKLSIKKSDIHSSASASLLPSTTRENNVEMSTKPLKFKSKSKSTEMTEQEKVTVRSSNTPSPNDVSGSTTKTINLTPLSAYPTDRWSIYREGVTQGLLATFLTCPEKLKLRVVEGLSRGHGTSGALAFGSLFHEVLDRIYTYVKDTNGENTISRETFPVLVDTTLEVLKEKDMEKLNEAFKVKPEALEDLEINYGMCSVTLKKYFQRWYGDIGYYKWVELERIFDVPYKVKERLGIDKPDIRIRGKFDGVMRLGNKAVQPLWLFETKTKGQIDQEFINSKLSFDLQVMLYLWAMKHTYGETPQGVVYNLVRRPMLKIKKDESIPEFLDRIADDIDKRNEFYFERMEYPHMPNQLELWETQFDDIMRSLINWTEGAYHFKNPVGCKSDGWTCDFLPICGKGQSERVQYIRTEEVYPELRPGADV